jgi:hypothetical protein
MQEQFFKLQVRDFPRSIKFRSNHPSKRNKQENLSRHIRRFGEYRLQNQPSRRIVHSRFHRANATKRTTKKKQGINRHSIHSKNLFVSHSRIFINSLFIRNTFASSVTPIIKNKNIQIEPFKTLNIIQLMTEVSGITMKSKEGSLPR